MKRIPSVDLYASAAQKEARRQWMFFMCEKWRKERGLKEIPRWPFQVNRALSQYYRKMITDTMLPGFQIVEGG